MLYQFRLLKDNLDLEYCYYVLTNWEHDLQLPKLKDIISLNGKYTIYYQTKFNRWRNDPLLILKTAWCQNMLDILSKCNLTGIISEYSVKYKTKI